MKDRDVIDAEFEVISGPVAPPVAQAYSPLAVKIGGWIGWAVALVVGAAIYAPLQNFFYRLLAGS